MILVWWWKQIQLWSKFDCKIYCCV